MQRIRQHGFTLVEAIMVIVITGIIAGMVAVFLRSPIDAYVDTARRAALTDIADTAARFMARELQGALPNSVREDGARLEFIPIRTAGRYRADVGGGGALGGADLLDFTAAADSSFEVLGPPVVVGNNESLVVYNLGIPGASAYEWPLSNRRVAAAGGSSNTVSFTPTASPVPFASPGSRFHIVGEPVTYVCDLAGRQLLRYTGYGFPNPSTINPTAAYAGATPDIVATRVVDCGFSYDAGALQRFGLVSIRLAIESEGERVTMQHQVNVDNVP